LVTNRYFSPLNFPSCPIPWLILLSIENVAQDLESFSRHAGRTTVTTDDVLLITRRNEALHGIMRDFVEKEQVAAQKGKGKGAKGKGKGKR
jgi:centromere protein S